jgi:hypothetical protein
MWASDTMDGRVKSLDGNRYGQVLSTESYFAEIYPMASKKDTGQALKTFVLELGVPAELTIDGSKEQNMPGTEFSKCCHRNDIKVTRAEPKHPNQNPAEGVIREARRPNHDQEASSKKALGLRRSMDDANYATNIHTSWRLERMLPIGGSDGQNSRYFGVLKLRFL